MSFLNKNKFIVPAMALLCFAVGHFLHRPFSATESPTVIGFEEVLHKKEKRLNDEMLLLAEQAQNHSYQHLFALKPAYYNNLMSEEGLALLIYENDTLKFWSDNSIAVENWIKEVCLDSRTVKLRNGWFEVVHPHTNATTTKTVVGLILIKNEYPYQNKYLVNEFQKDFSVPPETHLINDNPNAGKGIKNINGQYLFSLEFDSVSSTVSFWSYVAVVLNLLGFFLVVLFVKTNSFALQNKIGKNYSILLFIGIVVLLRYLAILLSFPESFYSFDLFDPRIYADAGSNWLTSLGDLLINTVLLFYLSYIMFTEFDFRSILSGISSRSGLLVTFIVFLGFYWFSWLITRLFSGIILNSNIPFSINNLFSLNEYSYVGIIFLGLLLFVYFLFADKMIVVLKELSLKRLHYVSAFIFASAIHIALSFILGTIDLVVILWPVILIVCIALIRKDQSAYPFSGIVFLVFLFTLYAVHVLILHTDSKEKESRKIYAERLAAEQDPVAELLFKDVEKKLIQDTVLSSFANTVSPQQPDFEKRIKQQYFSGYWEKYDVEYILFDSMCVPAARSQNVVSDNMLFLDERISKGSKKTSSENFYSLDNTSGKISYLARVPLYRDLKINSRFGVLYIELDAKFISDEIGFPELLLDRNIGLSRELTNYSYAKYKNGILVSQYGKFPYSVGTTEYERKGVIMNTFIDANGFNHLIFHADAQTLIVMSKKNEGFIGQLTTFSYLFSFFSLLLITVLLIRQISMGRLIESFSFKYRIQVLLVFIVLSSLALFGGGTIYYIKQQFETKNKENISEKIHSVKIDIEDKLISENKLTSNLSEYISFLLKKASSVFFTDINFYDTQGNLYASSSSKVFDEGLTSKKMNPEAFLHMSVMGKTEFTHDERIGKLEYLSAYIPFKNKDGKLLAYLNLPYFAKQSELEKEISGFLVALINIYVFLFALSIITAILIANYVTKPLKLIQDKLSNIRLGKTNEPIEWNENDEIGSLVSEYNRMIAELAKSAELLARSERESAWREMAKQVAHEIKNPLTPMKLSVQHLQRTYKDHAPDMDTKMERLTKTIIEQIDTLSSIATEFSNFAKMPKANLEIVNLKEVLMSIVDLYKNSSDTELVFNHLTSSEPLVMADKEQLIRMFNNLVKNAIQSVPESQPGFIGIDLVKEGDQYLTSVRDNGTGISEDVVEKIFVPNFTTKTGGMGLGLAMVKNIVETMNGRIWFETSTGSGTVFYVCLPALNESQNNP